VREAVRRGGPSCRVGWARSWRGTLALRVARLFEALDVVVAVALEAITGPPRTTEVGMDHLQRMLAARCVRECVEDRSAGGVPLQCREWSARSLVGVRPPRRLLGRRGHRLADRAEGGPC